MSHGKLDLAKIIGASVDQCGATDCLECRALEKVRTAIAELVDADLAYDEARAALTRAFPSGAPSRAATILGDAHPALSGFRAANLRRAAALAMVTP